MSDSPKVLVVLTSHGKLGDTGKPTGWYLSELAHPYTLLTAQGFTVTLASPTGGPAPLDPSSIEAASSDAISQAFLTEQNALWESTAPLESFLGRADDFAAIFFPGGHGPMFDLAEDPTSQALIQEFASKDKVVAAVCHGPAALVGVKGSGAKGEAFLNGRAVTGFTNAEEEEAGLDAVVPFLLEDRLVQVVGKGGRFEKADEKWAEKVVVDGKLITGQNPASAKGVAEAIVQAVWGA
ncbi:class I glutamine amidotransferase-like protein [Parachaetomium inaequale]|uniref:D-lactate dehydratase n=1 Tax=Parachaetomium inaequale TaxID=2588326 RepID=A0AAN6SUY0_9PEZI|nr:class I glutamine amidotransferase-like protein [Parachaetomium inaequale]